MGLYFTHCFYIFILFDTFLHFIFRNFFCGVLAGKPISLIKILPRMEENGIEYVWLICLINYRQSTDFLIRSAQRSEGRSLIPHPISFLHWWRKKLSSTTMSMCYVALKITLNRSEVSFSTVAYIAPSPKSGCFDKIAHLVRLSFFLANERDRLRPCVAASTRNTFFQQTFHAIVLDCVQF